MKTLRYTLVIMLGLMAAQIGKACDICGCSAAMSAGSLFPQVQTNMFGLRQSAQAFTHPRGNFNGLSEVKSDHYYESDLFFRWFPKKRLQVWIHAPYRVMNRIESERITTVRGMGDVQVRAFYTVIRPDTTFRKFKHMLQLGGGMSLPTGKYRQRDAQLTLLPMGLQSGTGAWSGMLNAIYMVQTRKMGLAVQADLRGFGSNEDTFKKGATGGVGTSFFLRRHWFRNVLALPQLGFRYDGSMADEQYGFQRPDSGSSGAQCSIGLDCFGKGWMAGVHVARPFERNQAEKMPQPGMWMQLSVGVIW